MARITLLFFLISMAVVFSIITVYRMGWTYNENGMYFVNESATSYSEGAVVAYFSLSLVFAIPAALLMISRRRRRNK